MTAPTRTALAAAAAILAAACSRPKELPDAGVSLTSLSFEAPGAAGEPAAQTFYVVNTGRGDLARPSVEVAYQDGAGWLAATVSGSGAPYAVAVKATVAGLAPATYRATLTVSCANASSSPLQVGVTLAVPDPRFTLSTASVTFDAPRGGADPAAKTFQVLNGGRGTLPVPDVAISYVGASGWLSATVGGTPDAYTVELAARVAGLDTGTYTAIVAVSAAAAEGPPRTLSVTLNVPPAEIGLSTASLAIDGPYDGSDPYPVPVSVTNAGGGFLSRPSASVTYEGGYAGTPWLEVAVSGSDAPYTITVQPHQAHAVLSIPSGTYVATVHVTAPDAAESQAFGVTFRVPPPAIMFSSWGAWFSNVAGCALPPAQTFAVMNGGAGVLARPTVTLSDPAAASWLSVDVTGDDVPYSVAVSVTGRAPAAQPGEWTEVTLWFDAPGAPRDGFTISYLEEAVAANPTLSVAPASLSVWAQDGAGDPPTRTFEVTTQGICSPALQLSVTYADGDPAWLSTTDDALAPDRHRITVSASPAGLQPGTGRDATIVVSLPEKPWVTASVPFRFDLGALRPYGSMCRARHLHTLTALSNGTVLAVGGETGGSLTTAELWSPTWGWGMTYGMSSYGRHAHGATAIDGYGVLVCGGIRADGSLEDSCEYGSPYWGWEWTSMGRLIQGRRTPTLVPVAGGRYLVVSPGACAEFFATYGGSPRLVPEVSAASAVTLPDGRVLAAGGGTLAWTYDPASDAFAATGALRHVMEWPALASLPDGGVLAIGDELGQPVAERWDPATGSWREVPPPLGYHVPYEVATLENGKVIATGGPGGTVEVFDPVSEGWSAPVAFPTARYGAEPVRLPSGQVLIIGGESAAAPYADLAEVLSW